MIYSPLIIGTICIFLCNVAFAKESEIFSSIAELERLYRTEAEVVKKLNEYTSVLDRNLHVIKKWVKSLYYAILEWIGLL